MLRPLYILLHAVGVHSGHTTATTAAAARVAVATAAAARVATTRAGWLQERLLRAVRD